MEIYVGVLYPVKVRDVDFILCVLWLTWKCSRFKVVWS